MKRSVSRTSKVSIDGQDSYENPFSGISETEWLEFLEKEENDLFILSVREEILQKCMEICLKNYLEKQSVGFTVHCAYLAWSKVLNMYYMLRDPGDTDDPEVKDSWAPDEEPPSSIIDSWGIDCIEHIDPCLHRKGKERKVSTTDFRVAESNPESLESCSFFSDFFDTEEGGYFFLPEFNFFISPKVSHEPSIFTRTLSMSRESLPLVKPLTNTHRCKNNPHPKKKASN